MTFVRSLIFLIASALIALTVIAFSYAPDPPALANKRCLRECQRDCDPPEICLSSRSP